MAGHAWRLAAAMALAAPAAAFGGDLSTGGVSTACSARVVAIAHVRPTDDVVAAALREGVYRSATMAALVERLDALDGLVFVSGHAFRRPQEAMLNGAMSHEITTAGGYRMLKVAVYTGRGDATIATIAHELRHAVEVLESADATDAERIDRLYQRIGFVVRRGVYETDAATSAQRQVYGELQRCRK